MLVVAKAPLYSIILRVRQVTEEHRRESVCSSPFDLDVGSIISRPEIEAGLLLLHSEKTLTLVLIPLSDQLLSLSPCAHGGSLPTIALLGLRRPSHLTTFKSKCRSRAYFFMQSGDGFPHIAPTNLSLHFLIDDIDIHSAPLIIQGPLPKGGSGRLPRSGDRPEAPVVFGFVAREKAAHDVATLPRVGYLPQRLVCVAHPATLGPSPGR